MKQQTASESVQALGPLDASSSGPSVRHRLQKYMGGIIFIGVVVETLLLWIVLRPAHQQDHMYMGEVLGILAVVLYSGALVTAMRIHPLESLFGGIDLLYRWHRSPASPHHFCSPSGGSDPKCGG